MAPRQITPLAVEDSCPAGQTPVLVYTDAEIPADMHWSTAVARGIISLVAEYRVPVIEDFASESHVAQIHAAHPGMTLVYL